MMARVIIKTRNVATSLESTRKSFNLNQLPEKRQDDFHVNPSQFADVVPELTLKSLLCTICNKFPPGRILECKMRGHVVCEDCYTLLDSEYGCVHPLGPWKDTRCSSPFWDKTPSKALAKLVAILQFKCLNSLCEEAIPGTLWKTHLETCKVLKEFIICPHDSCKGRSVAKTEFISHCQGLHGIEFSTGIDPCYYFDLMPSKFKDGPAVVMILEHEDRILYMAAMNDGLNYVRLAAFLVHRDVEWASRFKIVLTTQGKMDHFMSVTLKVNPAERDWNDLRYFGRSPSIMYAQLDDIFSDSKSTLEDEKRYRFQVKIEDASKPSHWGNRLWDGLSLEEQKVLDACENRESDAAGQQPLSKKQSVKQDCCDGYAAGIPREVENTRQYRILMEEGKKLPGKPNHLTRYPNIHNVRPLQVFQAPEEEQDMDTYC